jgi:Flp pilus assembly pilin Flp
MVKASIIRLLGDRSGASSLEYALAVMLIGVCAVAAFDSLGSSVSKSTLNTNDKLVSANRTVQSR